MVSAGVLGCVESGGYETLLEPSDWPDNGAGGAGPYGTGGSGGQSHSGFKSLFIGTTVTPLHGTAGSALVAEWDKSHKDVANGAINGFQVYCCQSGSSPLLNFSGYVLGTADGFYGGSGHYRGGYKALDDREGDEDSLLWGVGRGPQNGGTVWTACSVSDLTSWMSGRTTGGIVFYILASARDLSSTTTNTSYKWERSIDSQSMSNGNAVYGSGNPWFQDASIVAAVNSGYTPNTNRNGIHTGECFMQVWGGGRGGVILPSVGDTFTCKIRVVKTWTAPNPDQTFESDYVYWTHEWT